MESAEPLMADSALDSGADPLAAGNIEFEEERQQQPLIRAEVDDGLAHEVHLQLSGHEILKTMPDSVELVSDCTLILRP